MKLCVNSRSWAETSDYVYDTGFRQNLASCSDAAALIFVQGRKMDRQKLREIGRRADIVGRDRELRRSVRPTARPLAFPLVTVAVLIAAGLATLFLALA